jgi:hypothetical protein
LTVFTAGGEILLLIPAVAKSLTVSTAGGAKFRQIVVLRGSLACGRRVQSHMAQTAQGKSAWGGANFSKQGAASKHFSKLADYPLLVSPLPLFNTYWHTLSDLKIGSSHFDFTNFLIKVPYVFATMANSSVPISNHAWT